MWDLGQVTWQSTPWAALLLRQSGDGSRMGTMRAEVVRTRRVSAWPHRRCHRLQRSLPEWHRCEMKQHFAEVRQRYNVVMDLLNLVHDPDVFQGVQPMLAEVRPSFVKKAACLVELELRARQRLKQGAGQRKVNPTHVLIAPKRAGDPIGGPEDLLRFPLPVLEEILEVPGGLGKLRTRAKDMLAIGGAPLVATGRRSRYH